MTSERTKEIETKLSAAFSPVKLVVKDQSHLHVGHEGAKSGGGHFHVVIVSNAFENQRPIERHRMIFSALGSMMDNDIHALRIQASTVDESQD